MSLSRFIPHRSVHIVQKQLYAIVPSGVDTIAHVHCEDRWRYKHFRVYLYVRLPLTIRGQSTFCRVQVRLPPTDTSTSNIDLRSHTSPND